MTIRSYLPLLLVTSSCASFAQNSFNPDFSLILDGRYKSSENALSEQEKGFGLGHVELSVSAPVDDLFFGKFTGVLHQHHGKTEFEAEEAFVQTLALPAGLSIRGGRFLSNVGYLNSQHTHADSFTDRPGVYRAFLGSHYYDDGVRLELLMPTDFYWTAGLEILSGKKMHAANIHNTHSVGVYTAFTKIGGDIGESQSWQAGLSYMHNNNGITVGASAKDHTHHHEHHDEHEHSDEHKHEHHDEHEHSNEHKHEHHEAHNQQHHNHDHAHCHNAQYTGKHLYGVDAVWKWAPGGNYKYQSLAISGEYLRIEQIQEKSSNKDNHDGWYLSSVYQFSPQWATGVRYGEFNGASLNESIPHEQKLQETEWMLSWSHSHFSTLRLQYTHQQGDGLKHISDNAVTLQYTMSLGAHDAHQF